MSNPQKAEPKPLIPDDITEMEDHDAMECLIGKDAMKEMDSIISELDGDDETMGA